jgi:hypothetical protein
MKAERSVIKALYEGFLVDGVKLSMGNEPILFRLVKGGWIHNEFRPLILTRKPDAFVDVYGLFDVCK